MHETDSFSMGSSDRNGHTSIRREYKNFYHFTKNGNPGLSSVRRETMFINVLEGLHPLEAEILCLCKDKKLSDNIKLQKKLLQRHILIFNGEVVRESYEDFYLKTAIQREQRIVNCPTIHS